MGKININKNLEKKNELFFKLNKSFKILFKELKFS